VTFTDAYLNTHGQVVVTTWQNIDDEDETPERRTMTPEAFRAEFGDSVPVAEGLFA
jgi:hypothetical protein